MSAPLLVAVKLRNMIRTIKNYEELLMSRKNYCVEFCNIGDERTGALTAIL